MKTSVTALLCLLLNSAFAQNLQFARNLVDTLTSPYFWGRGYTRDGMQKAALFLMKEFKAYGVAPLIKGSYFQDYSYPVNTFPGKMYVELNGSKLLPGKDFIVGPASPGIKSSVTLIQKDSIHFTDREGNILVSLENKLTWSVSEEVVAPTVIKIDRGRINTRPVSLNVNIENQFVKDFKASNVCGIVRGTTEPDSILVLTAHYDHLGGMGADTYFPGANDNASGISLLLDLAKYYAQNPLPYSVAFICFSGEEAGLLGSKHFSEQPPFDLRNIRFLLNMDLTGTGNEGITVVNATEFKKEFDLLKQINTRSGYLTRINSRGKAANSDHYWFSQMGIPSFFIYTMGGIKAYHDVYDIASTLPLNAYENLFKLIVDFNSKLLSN
ncbi:M28 family metallopeptidase [Desertivirga xinjiangensis]|uniref:M28 family metallopeptidase n=1 Tax=Desertivirga xinjiangensis TaxID=539206 RepID=UPI00210EE260|nr:M28 family peptidase [Pedobacter xinjiangensis]